jgi:Dickkopf N-terminal cysteine-rich region
MSARVALFWLVSACALAGCSLLTDPDSLTIKCEVTPGGVSADPCLPAGMHCVDSECKPCKGATEKCNGVDDDCDGVIDNGFDEDGDGFTFCGGGLPEFADCAPNDPAIHPAGKAGPDGVMTAAPTEICDGKDNDCDSKVDEAPECAAMRGCTLDENCPTGQVCDTKTGMGVCIAPRPVGSGCTLDAECAGGFCVKPQDFGLSVKLTDNRCASACCTDSDCASGSVCVVNEAGSRLCLPTNIAARPARVDRCTRDEDCAFGACDRNRCESPCFSEQGCVSSGACIVSPGNGTSPRRWLCGDSAGQGFGEAMCTATLLDPNGCRSGLCTDRGSCAKACGHNADCGTSEVCGYSTIRPTLPLSLISIGPTSVLTACEPRAAAESDAVLCCTSSDCGKAGLCAPQAVDTNLWAMICR